MCGIAGAVSLRGEPVPFLAQGLGAMNALQQHRGPDGEGIWVHPRGVVGFAHRRLAIIDLVTGHQPMTDGAGHWITYNGEIYNYLELRAELAPGRFTTSSDTEVVLAAYRRWGEECVTRFRGMFAFALWDEARQALFCARDRFGIKPLYYAEVDGVLRVASEAKALLPFLPEVATDLQGLKDYLTFQFCLEGKTLFRGIRELLPGEGLVVGGGQARPRRYWELDPQLDGERAGPEFAADVRRRLEESVALHLRSDVPMGAYVSGGLDSSIVASLAAMRQGPGLLGFTGKFGEGEAYDESSHARTLARARGIPLHEIVVTAHDFVEQIERVVYHLDYPVAGPGSFPQYVVSGAASRHRKVLLGGQGGDEIFGGYARYLIAHLDQCLTGAIEGAGDLVTAGQALFPHLHLLRDYKPLLQEFWRDGLFESLDRRYFRLVNRAAGLGGEIDWDALGDYSPYETFRALFRGANGRASGHVDRMTRFDFKTLLPALLHVEDRVSMAHGVESRVPFLDTPLVELAATIPAAVKIKDGALKHMLKEAVRDLLPASIVARRDKMGFPVPLHDWLARPGPVRDFVADVFGSRPARERDVVRSEQVLAGLGREPRFGRGVWGLLCLELWQRAFHDRAAELRGLARRERDR